MKEFEMAHADNPEQIIAATQASVLKAVQHVFDGLKEDLEKSGKKTPGLTWEQLKAILDEFKRKQPTVLFQEEPI